ncbi:MAG: hypothetical protein ACKOGB_12100 [Betaproteobacteria bacterium]
MRPTKGGAQGFNALNRDIEPARDYQAPGRQFFAGLRWEGR